MFGILSLIIAVGVAAAILHGFWYQRSIERRFPPTGEIVDINGGLHLD